MGEHLIHRRYLAIVVALHLQTLGKINENIRIGRNDSLLVHSATRRREFGFHSGTARKSERVVPRERTVVRCIVNTTARSLQDEQLTKQKNIYNKRLNGWNTGTTQSLKIG